MFRRILSLLLISGLGSTLVVFSPVSAISIGTTNEAQPIAVEPKRPQLICPGPVYVNGGQNGLTIGKFTQSGLATVIGRDGSSQINFTATGIRTIEGKDSSSKTLNAIQSQRASISLASGLAAANCSPGVNDAWLVAGDNSVGREALLVLSNPSGVDSTVSLKILGTNGEIPGTGLSGISVPAGKVTVLPLAAFAPKAATFAVHVSSRGAMLGVWLQQKTIRGLTPGGLDYISPANPASKTLDIPGLFIRTSAKLAVLVGQSADYSDTSSMLRLVAPGEADAAFTAQVQGADGTNFGTVIQGTVPAGSARDFQLSELTDGNYIVHIESDEKLLASVRFSRVGTSEPDFAWTQAVSASSLDAGFTTVRGSISKLSIVNSGEKDGSATLNGRKFVLPALGNTVIELISGTNYSLTTTVPASASVVIDIGYAIAVTPVIDYQSLAGTAKVILR